VIKQSHIICPDTLHYNSFIMLTAQDDTDVIICHLQIHCHFTTHGQCCKVKEIH